MRIKKDYDPCSYFAGYSEQPYPPCKLKRFLCLSWLVVIGGFFPATGIAQWNMLSQPFSGRGTHRLIDSKYALFASTDYGLYRSFDTGLTWDLIAFQGQNLSGLEEDSTGHLYVISGDVYVSSDSGGSWIPDHNPQSSIAVSPDNMVYGNNAQDGVQVSTDQGKHWTNLNIFVPDKNHLFTLSNGEIGLFSEDGLYRSFDRGHSFQQLDNVVGSSLNFIRPIPPTTLIVGSYTAARIVYSTDNGGNWRFFKMDSAFADFNVRDAIFAPNGALLIASSGGILRSLDTGHTWSLTTSGLTQVSVENFLVKHDKIYAGTFGGGMCQSDDNGLTWSQPNSGLASTHVNCAVLDRNEIPVLGTSDGVFINPMFPKLIYHSHTIKNGRKEISALAIDQSDRFYAGTSDQGILISVDSGHSWTPSLVLSDSVTAIAVDSAGAAIVTTRSHGVYRSADYGSHWYPLSCPLGSEMPLSLATSKPATVFCGGSSGSLFRSKDSGASWDIPFHSDSIGRILSIVVAPDLSIIAGSDRGMVVSTDLGESWKVKTIRDADDVKSVCANSLGHYYVASRSVWIHGTADRGATWYDMRTYKGNALASIVMDNSNVMYAVYEDGYIYRSYPTPERVGGSKLLSVVLGRTFPNPSNNRTTLEYEVEKDEALRLELRDVLGRIVKVIEDGVVVRGRHSIVISTSNLSPGTYTVVLQVNSDRLIQHLIVVR